MDAIGSGNYPMQHYLDDLGFADEIMDTHWETKATN